jgi:hypothetical protein
MPRRYDSAACVTELSAKASIRAAIAGGWAVVEPGCVAQPATPAVVPFGPPCPSTPGVWAKSKACRSAAVVAVAPVAQPTKKCKISLAASSVSVLDAGRQVVHMTTGRTHLWRSGNSTICALWRCGSPDDSAGPAMFAKIGETISDTVFTPLCRSCYSKRLDFLRIPEVSADADDPSDDLASSCESISVSCSSQDES